jgi:hypothetical protein
VLLGAGTCIISNGINDLLKLCSILMTKKFDKIKALTLAKECYTMKLELLTNATVVDDAIRFVALHAAPITEKANSDERVTVAKEVSNSDDIQGFEENRSHKQQSTTTTTNNSIF